MSLLFVFSMIHLCVYRVVRINIHLNIPQLWMHKDFLSSGLANMQKVLTT